MVPRRPHRAAHDTCGRLGEPEDVGAQLAQDVFVGNACTTRPADASERQALAGEIDKVSEALSAIAREARGR